MQLTRNFSREEFDCRDGTPVPPRYYPNLYRLARQLQILRNEVGILIVLSGYRTRRHNRSVGGADYSKHLTADAADLRSPYYTPQQLHGIIVRRIREGKLHNGGLGRYDTFIHYDMRPRPARW